MYPTDPSKELEEESNIRLLRRGKATSPDELLVLLKMCREALIKAVTSFLRDIWNERRSRNCEINH